ncbi:MAPK/MAK/MRK overlapping kinase isoform X3 [Oryctolagus cuniculus]|uniref:MAPK/MAK/MRK overlapping kinase isoform X3 n=1 Tax=Oryctolagus cuniculus TaxID=9986 RepID=UPI0022321783|nr:MAPK/MAK/MRK overlapping kinase isoform X3 [Oryctolagus cuniculus]
MYLASASGMKDYRAVGKLGEGTFSEVVKLQNLRDGNYYACKRMRQHFESLEQVNSLREVQALRRLNPHPNILTLHEVVLEETPTAREENRALHVPALPSPGPHAQERHISQRRQTRKYTNKAGRPEIRGLRLVPERLLQAAVHGVHLHPLVPGPGVPPDRRLLHVQDGRVERRLRVLRDCQGGSQPGPGRHSPAPATVPLCPSSLRPLFPGTNELDQISKIHDVIGTPAQETLTKFQQSRAMNFDFPFKKGSGIPLPTASLSPQCLSLLHAMVAYDPDTRIAAHQALQHPYFQEQRAAERQALAGHRRAAFPEHAGAPEPPSHGWPMAKEGRKQKAALKQEDAQPRRAGPGYVTELPPLQLPAATKLSSHSSPALPSAFAWGASGTVPRLRPLQRRGPDKQRDARRDAKPHLKPWRLPAIDRKGGGC